jgi:hypothetical protein
MEAKKIVTILVMAMGLMFCLPKVGNSETIGTAFTYQGRLIDADEIADGLYDFQFKLFDSAGGAGQVGGDVYRPDVDVVDGYFTAELDFGGGSFDGSKRWLEIGIRPGELEDPNAYTKLSPRQEVTPNPYALYAKTAGSGGDNDWMISGNNMYSIPSGNVGIGTTIPDEELVVGTPLGSGWVIPAVTVGGPSGGVFQCGNPTYKLSLEHGSTWKRARIVSSDDAGYGQGDIEFKCGNVGIGTTSPSSKLHIEDDTSDSLALTIHNLDNTGSERILFGTGSGSDAGIIVWGSTNATYPGKWRFFNNKTSGHYDWISSGAIRMTLTNDGSLGIGTTSPDYKLEVNGSMGTSADATGKLRVGRYSAGSPNSYISASGGADQMRLQIGDSTKMVIASSGNVGIGTESPAEKLTVRGGNLLIERSDGTDIVELGEGLDYAEGFDVSDKSRITSGSVLIIDSENPGKLAISNKAYDNRVAGIVAGAKGMGSGVHLGSEQFDYDVALAGRVYCNVDATEAAVQPGDLLTTSATSGYAMKAADYNRAQGAILGKAMEKLEKGKKGQILVLVTLQ